MVRQVKKTEVSQVLDHLKEHYGLTSPKLTVILVTKRIDDRFVIPNEQGN